MGPKLPAWITSALLGHASANLLDGDHRIHQAAALAAILLGNGDAEEPDFGSLAGDVEGESRCLGALARLPPRAYPLPIWRPNHETAAVLR